jgi:hypothetical protein
MDPKPRQNHAQYLKVLRAMTPAQRLRKAFELTELGRRLFADGLRGRYNGLPDNELRRVYLQRVAKCHNRNY